MPSSLRPWHRVGHYPFFYQLAVDVHPAADSALTGKPKIQIWLAAHGASTGLAAPWERLPLPLCRATGAELASAAATVQRWSELENETKWDQPLTPTESWNATNLTQKASAFETVLRAELQQLPTYHATAKGIYSMPDLIDNAHNIFPESVQGKLNEHVMAELREAGRCLAFDNSTASGFHSMRALERAMHYYYLAVCRPKSKAELDSCGAYISALHKHPGADVKRVVSLLQQIKDHDRNLIIHPYMMLTPDDALELFEVTQGAILAMAKGLPSPRPRRSRSTTRGGGASSA